jgi:hypothetical protein
VKITRELHGSVRQLPTDVLSLQVGRYRDRAEQCAIGIEFEGGAPDDLLVPTRHERRFEMLAQPLVRQPLLRE